MDCRWEINYLMTVEYFGNYLYVDVFYLMYMMINFVISGLGRCGMRVVVYFFGRLIFLFFFVVVWYFDFGSSNLDTS